MAGEFEIIERYFGNVGVPSGHTALAIGDDAAVVDVPPGQQLVVSMDTLICGTHFTPDTKPADVGYKALAVNLSDLAAMGAQPVWFLLSLSLDHSDESWLSQFADGLREAANLYRVQLIGGDTCRGALAISIQIAGLVPAGEFVTRASAAVGDIVVVSGELGNAALGLASTRGEVELPAVLRDKCQHALKRPQPRLELGNFLRDYASAAIDISDGLVGDLRHILDASGVGARIAQAALPVNQWIREREQYDYALGGGDDYEICCCVAPGYRDRIEAWNDAHGDCQLTPVGEIVAQGYQLRVGERLIDLGNRGGYRHFD